MSAVKALYGGLLGLFVDDGSLALAVLAVVVLAGVVAALMPEFSLGAGVILLLGCLGVLVANVLRVAKAPKVRSSGRRDRVSDPSS
jgi:hypothetical protein